MLLMLSTNGIKDEGIATDYYRFYSLIIGVLNHILFVIVTCNMFECMNDVTEFGS